MKSGARRAAALATVALTAVAAPSALADSGVSRGPSTTKNPYVIPATDGVRGLGAGGRESGRNGPLGWLVDVVDGNGDAEPPREKPDVTVT